MKLASKFAPVVFVLLWATGFIGARYAMPWAEPFGFLIVRFIIAGGILAMIAWLTGCRAAPRRDALHAMIAGSLMHGVYLGGVFWSIHAGMPAGLSALIVGLQPLITALMAGWLLGNRILPRHWIGLGVGFAGVVIVVLPTLGAAATGVNAATLSASTLAVVAMSAGTIWQKRFVGRLDLIAATTWQYLGAGLVMTAAAAAFETPHFVVNGQLVFAMAWLVLVLSLGAVFLLMYLIREGEVAKVASLFYLVPAVTAVMAWVLFDETLGRLQIAGIVVASVGVALATAQPGRRARASR